MCTDLLLVELLLVTSAICRYRNNYIQFPATQNGITAMKQEFYDIVQSPNVIGVIYGTLVFIRAPVEDEHLYVSRKGGHSINILGVCDAKLRFTYAVSKYPGSTHDAYIWNNSNLCLKFERGDMENIGRGWLLGDSGYV